MKTLFIAAAAALTLTAGVAYADKGRHCREHAVPVSGDVKILGGT